MLALVTVGAVTALLLAGTFKGLWSYYLTMKSIGSKLDELDQAEKLKTAVGDLLPHDTEKLKAAASDLRQQMGKKRTEVDELQEKINDVRRALSEYTRAFQSTVNRELETDDPRHIEGILHQLDVQLDSFTKAAQVEVPGL